MPAGTIILGVNSLFVWRVVAGRSVLFITASFCCYLQTEESANDKGSEAEAREPPPFTVRCCLP